MSVLIVLAQEIFTVIIAVGRAHDHVNMIFVGLGMLPKRDATLMIELDNDHRALQPVIKCAVVFDSAHPAKIGIVQVPFDLFELEARMARVHPPNMVIRQAQQQIVLRIR